MATVPVTVPAIRTSEDFARFGLSARDTGIWENLTWPRNAAKRQD